MVSLNVGRSERDLAIENIGLAEQIQAPPPAMLELPDISPCVVKSFEIKPVSEVLDGDSWWSGVVSYVSWEHEFTDAEGAWMYGRGGLQRVDPLVETTFDGLAVEYRLLAEPGIVAEVRAAARDAEDCGEGG